MRRESELVHMGNFAATIFMVKEFGQDFRVVIKVILSNSFIIRKLLANNRETER